MPINDTEDRQFMNNPRLRHANTIISYTKDEIDEYVRCQEDILHFVKHIKIQTTDKGLVNFQPYEYQKKLIPLFQNERFVLVKNPRQSGKTTTAVAYLLHFILTNKDKNVAILSNKGDTSREIMNRLQIAYENLPKYLQQGIVTWNKGTIELENGCRVMALSTTSSAARSYSFSVIYIDEMAFIESRTWEPFWKSVYPTISSSQETKIILVSTPHGLNHFYKFWTDAGTQDNLFVPFSVQWNDIPGRDEKWKKETIAQIGIAGWRQEFECVSGDTHITIKHKNSNIIEHIPIQSAFEYLKTI